MNKHILALSTSLWKGRLAGTVFAGGVTEPGEVNGHSALEEAYCMGKDA